jgi:hypothetical protein
MWKQFRGLCMRIILRTIKDIATIVNVPYWTVQTILTCDLNIWTLLQSSYTGFRPPNRKITVLKFVKSFVSMPWMTHPSCTASYCNVGNCNIMVGTKIYYNIRGTRWCSWLRHCTTSWKVAGSVPDDVTEIFHWINPPSHTIALGLTQPLTKIPYFLIDNTHLMYNVHSKLFQHSFWCIDNAHDADKW